MEGQRPHSSLTHMDCHWFEFTKGKKKAMVLAAKLAIDKEYCTN